MGLAVAIVVYAALYYAALRFFVAASNKWAVRRAVSIVGEDKVRQFANEAPLMKSDRDWQSRREALNDLINVEILKLHRKSHGVWRLFSVGYAAIVIVTVFFIVQE